MNEGVVSARVTCSAYYSGPTHHPPDVPTQSGGALGLLLVLLIKPGCTLGKLLDGCLGHAQSVATEVKAEKIEPFLDTPDGYLVGTGLQIRSARSLGLAATGSFNAPIAAHERGCRYRSAASRAPR